MINITKKKTTINVYVFHIIIFFYAKQITGFAHQIGLKCDYVGFVIGLFSSNIQLTKKSNERI